MDYIILGIFVIVAGVLHVLAKLTHISYLEMNIVVYYIIIPISWLLIIASAYRVRFRYLLSLMLTTLLIAYTLKKGISQYLWDKSVALLNYPLFGEMDATALYDKYKHMAGSPTYIVNSFIICVVVPVVIYLLLLIFYITKRRKKHNPPVRA